MEKKPTGEPITEEKETKSKKSVRKTRLSKRDEELKKAKLEREQLHDQLLRKVAEFENYKKRTERDYLIRIQNANEELITELLNVLDDMERSIYHANESENSASILEGMELIYKKLTALLEKKGLEHMVATGEEFDPDKHDALLQVENSDYKSGHIVEEHLKGYTLNGKVIRHAQVIVAK